MGEHRNTNAITAGGQAFSPGEGVPESGMPAGGPDDLAIRAQEQAEERAAADSDPFGAGIDARAKGASLIDCPYPPHSDEGHAWADGFNHHSGAEAAA